MIRPSLGATANEAEERKEEERKEAQRKWRN